jgi:hypothetical protein
LPRPVAATTVAVVVVDCHWTNEPDDIRLLIEARIVGSSRSETAVKSMRLTLDSIRPSGVEIELLSLPAKKDYTARREILSQSSICSGGTSTTRPSRHSAMGLPARL